MAAGSLIAKESGAIVVSMLGDSNPVYADAILATNAGVHDQLKKIIKDSLDG